MNATYTQKNDTLQRVANNNAASIMDDSAQGASAKPTSLTEHSSASPSKMRKNPCRASLSSAKPSPKRKKNSPKSKPAKET